MKKLSYALLALAFLAQGASAQSWGSDHVNVGVYGDVFRVGNSGVDLAGLGARVSVKIMPMVQLEAESGYNFAESLSQGFSDFNGTVSVSRSQLRSLDVLFGPKLYTNRGPVRLFATVKGGFINFNVSTSPALTIPNVTTRFQNLNGTTAYGVFYPGGGAEAFWGPIGLRVDVGDEVFFNNGAHNNLRMSFGPTIRF